jgi:hypothetical protein
MALRLATYKAVKTYPVGQVLEATICTMAPSIRTYFRSLPVAHTAAPVAPTNRLAE